MRRVSKITKLTTTLRTTTKAFIRIITSSTLTTSIITNHHNNRPHHTNNNTYIHSNKNNNSNNHLYTQMNKIKIISSVLKLMTTFIIVVKWNKARLGTIKTSEILIKIVIIMTIKKHLYIVRIGRFRRSSVWNRVIIFKVIVKVKSHLCLINMKARRDKRKLTIKTITTTHSNTNHHSKIATAD